MEIVIKWILSLFSWLFSGFDNDDKDLIKRGKTPEQQTELDENEELPDPMTVYFIYKKDCGDISKRGGTGVYRYTLFGSEYINAYTDTTRKTFRVDRIVQMYKTLKELENASTEDINVIKNTSLIAALPLLNRKGRSQSYDIHFTGFTKREKNKLVSIARYKAIVVREKFGIGLNILCCGSRASMNKIELALEQGTKITSGDALLNYEYSANLEFIDEDFVKHQIKLIKDKNKDSS